MRRRGIGMASRSRLFGIVIGLLLLGSGCAGVDRSPIVDRTWPRPPELPRIKFGGLLTGERDVERGEVARFVRIFVGTRVSQSLSQPMGVALSPDGRRLYVVNYAEPAVFVFDFASGRMMPFGDDQEFRSPLGVAVDREGRVYVVDPLPRRIIVFAPSGKVLRTVVHPTLERPTGIAVDSDRRRIYVSDSSSVHSSNHKVRIFDFNGSYVGAFGGRGSEPGQFLFPTYVAVDGKGRVYVTDTLNSRVQVFDPDGRYLRTFGERGDAIGMFDKPKGVALDTFGNVYVVDSAWSNVQIFSPSGQVLLFFGGRGRAPGFLFNPTGIAIDRNNRIYVADAFNGRIAIYDLINTTADDSYLLGPEPRASDVNGPNPRSLPFERALEGAQNGK